MSNWQDIETAPKDGSWILTFRPGEIGTAVNQARWQRTIFDDYEWGGRGWAFPENSQPAHWMPLPDGPSNHRTAAVLDKAERSEHIGGFSTVRAEKTTLFDRHPDSPRLMYFAANGERYTPEQWRLIQFAEKLDKKLDRLIELLEIQQS